jgi:hypothetical protein
VALGGLNKTISRRFGTSLKDGINLKEAICPAGKVEGPREGKSGGKRKRLRRVT